MIQSPQIPFNFTARDYQIDFLREVQRSIEGRSDKRYFYQIWHRRSGKDKVSIADVIPRRLISKVGLVKMVYPTLVMGRDNLWDAIGSDGFKFIEHIPAFIRSGEANNTRMSVPIRTGSLFQVAGTDNPDSLRGGNAILYSMSEWAEHDPYAWDVIEPILRENDGIACFNTTPKGDNHARALYEYAKNSPKWWVQILTAKDTKIFTDRQLDEIQADIVSRFAANGRSQSEAEAYFDQEYMCSFNSPVIGSYYGAAINRAEQEGRLTSVPYDQGLGVITFWDLGVDDSTTIWFLQIIGRELRLIDYYENSGEGLPHYAKVLSDRGYVYLAHYAPHDIEVRELGSGKSRREIAKQLGINFKLCPDLSVDDGIEATRAIFTRCWFDKVKCERGIQALKNYRKEWDEKNKVFRSTPKHDWSSHGADAFRYLAIGYKDRVEPIKPNLPPGTSPWGGVPRYIEGIG